MYFALHCIRLLPRVSQLITTPHYIQSRDTIHSPRTPHIPPKILGKLIYIHILEVLEAFPFDLFPQRFHQNSDQKFHSERESAFKHLALQCIDDPLSLLWQTDQRPAYPPDTVHCTLHTVCYTVCSELHNCTEVNIILTELCISYLNCAFPTRATVHFLPVRGQCILGPEANQLGVHG